MKVRFITNNSYRGVMQQGVHQWKYSSCYEKCLLYKTAFNIGWTEKDVYVYTVLIFRIRRSWFMLIAYIHWFEKIIYFLLGLFAAYFFS
jgi:hypothetical protein